MQRAGDGPADAFRHCYWSCLMTLNIGEEDAIEIGNYHKYREGRNRDPSKYMEKKKKKLFLFFFQLKKKQKK